MKTTKRALAVPPALAARLTDRGPFRPFVALPLWLAQQIAGVTMAAEEALVFFGAFSAYLLRFLRDEQAAGLAAAPAAAARRR